MTLQGAGWAVTVQGTQERFLDWVLRTLFHLAFCFICAKLTPNL